ncbi:MAG: alpha-amylase domain-containing protein, partial [Paludibacteraceae bacterium]|nr:alpha-amylase domain-containing protein [Paludibacteraceae bacterium]
FNQRMGMAYATIMAMDGNVSVFMEDLFNLSNSNRYNHMPADEKSLPMRDYLKNLIWCHQNLAFKYGDYKVRWQDEDLLVIERSGKAIIAITDDGANAHDVWIDTDFRNVQLKDYSGGTSGERTAWGDGRFNVRVTPADGKGGLGYAVWAPIYESNYKPYRNKVTQQEWEMADDLGDSHCNSLGQGGALPEKSCEQRLVGKIYVESGKKISYNVYQEKTGNDVTFALYDLDGNQLHKKNSTKTITGSYTPTKTGWVAMKVWNTVNTNAGQKCWVNVAYQAPATVTGTMSDRADTRASIWTGNAGNTNWTDCGNWEQGKVPNASSTVVIPDNGDVQPVVTGNVTIKKLLVENGTGSSSNPDIVVNGKLTVSSSESKAGTTYVCGKGTINLGTQTGKFETGKLTDIDESQMYADLSIFPNPATSVLYIQSGELPQGEAYIYNTSGKLCKTVMLQGEEITAVEVADLSAGVYILRLGTQTLRFIKQ